MKRVLIANRGEIARRIIQACTESGIETVAVYTDADSRAGYLSHATQSRRIGDSYLQSDRIIQAAIESESNAIHPGYGFLAENAEFAEACQRSGLTFIGPPPSAMRLLGNKDDAKRLAQQAGARVVPGYFGEDQSDDRLKAEAQKIGFPLLIKAIAGGGGRGQRVVDNASDLAPNLAAARREAQGAFGDDRLMIEKLIAPARHVEVQILADVHGSAIHLFERDCSAQRRRQKIIEESPAPKLSSEARDRLTNSAVAIAKKAGYTNAGTVEFLVSGDEVYFLEVNARLQVEHPVTELVTGIDLVKAQLRIAQGLPAPDQPSSQYGWAIEARICAEDPYSNFAPSTGTALYVEWPRRPFVRVDSALESGDEITLNYDSLLGKVIAWGADRDEAIDRLRLALQETVILGIWTNVGFLIDLIGSAAFRSGSITIDSVENMEITPPPPTDEVLIALAQARPIESAQSQGPWIDAWRLKAQ
ncbi:MAG: ATP-grasp domain-containing protein [Armatimonadetes bacterium]|nr:ATP-grasp domain-containing protein [Armatimonadota bacterium]